MFSLPPFLPPSSLAHSLTRRLSFFLPYLTNTYTIFVTLISPKTHASAHTHTRCMPYAAGVGAKFQCSKRHNVVYKGGAARAGATSVAGPLAAAPGQAAWLHEHDACCGACDSHEQFERHVLLHPRVLRQRNGVARGICRIRDRG